MRYTAYCRALRVVPGLGAVKLAMGGENRPVGWLENGGSFLTKVTKVEL